VSSNELTSPAPQGDYVAAVLHGGTIYTAGMTPRVDGRLIVTGLVGATVSIEEARAATELAASNALAAARSVLPSESTGLRCLQMTVYIAAARGFTQLSAVADGGSAAIAAALGPGVLPARSAIGVSTLPSGAPVEVQLVAAPL
jgi:enamine deaminase RidA (YjgF/YER057c/UK114 family)